MKDFLSKILITLLIISFSCLDNSIRKKVSGKIQKVEFDLKDSIAKINVNFIKSNSGKSKVFFDNKIVHPCYLNLSFIDSIAQQQTQIEFEVISKNYKDFDIFFEFSKNENYHLLKFYNLYGFYDSFFIRNQIFNGRKFLTICYKINHLGTKVESFYRNDSLKINIETLYRNEYNLYKVDLESHYEFLKYLNVDYNKKCK